MVRSLLVIAASACVIASASAFCYSPAQCMSGSFTSKAALSAPRQSMAFAKTSRSAMPALRMAATEDDKAKASGVAVAILGLIISKFSLLIAVIVGGGAVYAAKLPEVGDKGLSDTAKQVSLLIGDYALKVFDFAKEKDAEAGITSKVTAQVKEAINSAKSNIKQG